MLAYLLWLQIFDFHRSGYCTHKLILFLMSSFMTMKATNEPSLIFVVKGFKFKSKTCALKFQETPFVIRTMIMCRGENNSFFTAIKQYWNIALFFIRRLKLKSKSSLYKFVSLKIFMIFPLHILQTKRFIRAENCWSWKIMCSIQNRTWK